MVEATQVCISACIMLEMHKLMHLRGGRQATDDAWNGLCGGNIMSCWQESLEIPTFLTFRSSCIWLQVKVWWFLASSVLFSPSGTFTDVAQRRLKRVPQLTRIKHKVEGTKLADGSLLKSVTGKLALQTIFGCYSGVLHIQSLSEQTQLVQSLFSRVLPQLVCGVNLGGWFYTLCKISEKPHQFASFLQNYQASFKGLDLCLC